MRRLTQDDKLVLGLCVFSDQDATDEEAQAHELLAHLTPSLVGNHQVPLKRKMVPTVRNIMSRSSKNDWWRM